MAKMVMVVQETTKADRNCTRRVSGSVSAQVVCDSVIQRTRNATEVGLVAWCSSHSTALQWAVHLFASLTRHGTRCLSCFPYVPRARHGAWDTEVLGTYLLNE